MSELVLQTAIGTYGHTQSLKDGSLKSPKFAMEHIEISPLPMIFRRMVRNLEFDVAEMALSTYFCAKHHGKAFTALPVFLTRSFYHGAIVYNTKSGIQSPDDLAGRKVGVRSYTFTPGVWTRGVLQSVYGVDLNSVTWVISGDEHVAEYVAPSHVIYSESNDLVQMLLSGEIDAAIGVSAAEAPELEPLFPHADAADAQWFEQTGIYPISHLLVVKNELLESKSWLAEDLYALLNTAKQPYLDALNSGKASRPEDQPFLKMAKIVGDDSISYSFENTKKTLETAIQFNVEQRIIPEPVSAEALFPANTLGLS